MLHRSILIWLKTIISRASRTEGAPACESSRDQIQRVWHNCSRLWQNMGTRKLITAGGLTSPPPAVARRQACPIRKQSRGTRHTWGPLSQWQARRSSNVSATAVVRAALAGLQGAMRRREATLPLPVDYGQVCNAHSLPHFYQTGCTSLTLRRDSEGLDTDEESTGLLAWNASRSASLQFWQVL